MKPQARALSILLVSLCTAAAAQVPDVTISVLMDRYAVGSRAYDDLEALDRDVKAMRPQAITIVACGSSAGPGVKAVGHRFRALPLTIVPRLDEEYPCSRPLLTPAGLRDRRASTDAEVQRYWESLLP
jgi:hypothetical protein